MYWFKIKENGYEYSIYSQNYMINNEYRKYTIRILYTYLQPKNKIFVMVMVLLRLDSSTAGGWSQSGLY